MYKVLLTDNVNEAAVRVFDGYASIEAVPTGTLERERLKEAIASCDAIIVRSPTRVTADVIDAAPRLRVIGRVGAGTDNIDVEAARRRGITVLHSPGGGTVSTAEHTIALILSLARRIPEAHRSVTGGEWRRDALLGVELCGKTLGIVGLGRIGTEVARRMAAFEMRLMAVDPNVTADEAGARGATLVDMDTLLRESDVITLHVPLGANTMGMIGPREIERMRDGVFIVNCCRGGVVQEAALVAALDSGKVAGVGLDVYECEPPGQSPLFSHPRSVFTPHLGTATVEAKVRVAVSVARAVAEALTAGAAGEGARRP